MTKKKRYIMIAICMALLFQCLPFMSDSFSANAASKKVRKMTVYSEVLKKGSKVYCMVKIDGMRYQLYQVDLKTSKAKRLTGNLYRGKGMSYKKGYVYFVVIDGSVPLGYLFRVTPGKKVQYLAKVGCKRNSDTPIYVLGKNKIYYKQGRWSDAKEKVVTKNKQMKLNGKNKKRLANSKFRVKSKKTNAKGYTIVYTVVGSYEDEEGTYYTYHCYLKKPNGKKIFITRIQE